MVEVNRKPIYLRKILHGQEIREAARALEKQRLMLNEDEILLGATLNIDWKDSTTAYLVSRRPETDNEYNARIERQRVAEEAKEEALRRKAERAAAEAKLREAQKREMALKTIQEIMSKNGIDVNDIKGK